MNQIKTKKTFALIPFVYQCFRKLINYFSFFFLLFCCYIEIKNYFW